jgi:hypothetical protein
MNTNPQGQPPGLPTWVKPQLCRLVGEPPKGPEWLHEIGAAGKASVFRW